MQPLITPLDYTDPTVFAAERDNIFLKRWLFAGLADDLPNHQDFRCLEVCGIPVILQNFEGEIKAFNNVCSHRFARLHREPCGNRELRCPYHGWIYNAEGIPYAIPRRPLIAEITPETLPDYRLSRWHVRKFGPLLFIKKEFPDRPPPAHQDLEMQFADFAGPLTNLTTALGEVVERTDYTISANWKIVVENTLEGYHVDWVHPTTIKKLGLTGLVTSDSSSPAPAPEQMATPDDFKPAGKEARGSQFTFTGENSAVHSPMPEAIAAKLDRVYSFLNRRPQRLEGYRHFYLFPNFVFASTRGESFSLQILLPVDEKSTRLTSLLFATNGLGEMTRMETALKKQFYLSAAEFVRAIFAEDVGICEEVQKGVGAAHLKGILSDEEERICGFQRACADALGRTTS
ncbi:MAG: aromatic ring-hydroxylating dioxygenase subunit alpha [Opitutaceae bacterium]